MITISNQRLDFPGGMQPNDANQPEHSEKYGFLNPAYLSTLRINLGTKKVYQLKNEVTGIPPAIQTQVNMVHEYVIQNIQAWDLQEKQEYPFDLPPTIFSGQRACVTFREQKFDVEQLQIGQLSPEQKQQIWRNATFVVPSKKFAYPYTWKLSQIVFSGRENINKAFLWHVAQGIGNLMDIARFVHNANFKQERQSCSVCRGLKNVIKVGGKLFGLLIGKPSYRKLQMAHEIECYRRELLLKAAERIGTQPANQMFSLEAQEHNQTLVSKLGRLNQELQNEDKKPELSALQIFANFQELAPPVKDNILALMNCEDYMSQQMEEISQKLHFCPKTQKVIF